jgi:LysR substrate binding domain
VLDAGELRLADIARRPWVAPYYQGPQSAAPIMRQFSRLDIQPHIAVRVESYLAVPHFVAGTDRVALMPERLAVRLADRTDLRVMECPGPTEPIVEALWVAPAVRRRHRPRLAAPAHRGGRPRAGPPARTGPAHGVARRPGPRRPPARKPQRAGRHPLRSSHPRQRVTFCETAETESHT